MHDPEELQSAPLAYKNSAFVDSPDGRILRILAEYQEPLARFRRQKIQDTVVFFGSARFHNHSYAQHELDVLERPGSAQHAAPEEQVKRARAAVEMARYYEDARRLAFLHASWAKDLPFKRNRFVVCTGGGPGIMEAANLGAREAGAKTIGLNIHLPYEQMPNRYITPELNFEFHYFFMRKYWFAYLAKALIVFPGGFGTMDELFEILTLAQTEKLAKRILVLMYGKDYWSRVLNIDALIDWGTISPNDVDLYRVVDSPEEAFEMLRKGLTKFHLNAPHPRQEDRAPGIAKTRPFK